MCNSLPSIRCLQGVFQVPSLINSPLPPILMVLAGIWYFVLEDTNKQTVRSYQNKWFHKATVSAGIEPSETLLGRGQPLTRGLLQ